MALEGGPAVESDRLSLHDLISLPFRRFAIDSELSPEEALARIRGIVEPRSPFLAAFSRTNKLFAGEVSRDGFKIMRIISYGNGRLPVVRGVFEATPSGTRVAITMRPMRLVAIFDAIWIGFAILILCLATISRLLHKGDAATATAMSNVGLFAILIALPVLGYGMAAISFGAEARKARNLLREALQRQPSARVQQVLDDPGSRRLPRFVKSMLIIGAIAFAASLLVSVLVPILR